MRSEYVVSRELPRYRKRSCILPRFPDPIGVRSPLLGLRRNCSILHCKPNKEKLLPIFPITEITIPDSNKHTPNLNAKNKRGSICGDASLSLSLPLVRTKLPEDFELRGKQQVFGSVVRINCSGSSHKASHENSTRPISNVLLAFALSLSPRIGPSQGPFCSVLQTDLIRVLSLF